MAELINQCEVVNEKIAASIDSILEGALPLEFAIACGQSYVAYESLFRNTRVTGTLVMDVFDFSDCTLTVTAERENREPVVRSVAPTDANRTISFIVDDLTKITISCGSGTGTCGGEYTLLLHWCKCC